MTSHRPAVRRVLIVTAGAAALGLGALSAPLTGPPGLSLIGTTSVRPGGEVSFTATGFPAGATLSVKFDDTTLLKQFPIGDDGSVSRTVTVPALSLIHLKRQPWPRRQA